MSVCRWLFLAYVLTLFFAPHLSPGEATYGFDPLSRFSIPAQVFVGLAWLTLFVPASNRAIRRGLHRVLAQASRWSRTTANLAGLGVCLPLFWALRSRTSYGDAAGTIYLLEHGEWFNWKEPLDRALTYLVALAGKHLGLWGAAAAMAAVSVTAGAIWLLASLTQARRTGHSLADRSIVLGLLLTPGIMQLFFGNMENYSLLAAGVLVFLVLGLRYLRGDASFAWPCLALALTCVTHLSACWLLPTLAFLYLARWRGGTLRFASPELWRGLVVTALPLVALLILGYARFGSLADLNFATFGGGDHRVWKPLCEAGGIYEKFPLLSWAHAIALANHLLLIAAIAGAITLGTLVRIGARTQRPSAGLIFVLLNLGLALAYIVLFNPDMAMYKVGLLNEWDLFSLPAVPAVVAAGLSLTEHPGDLERRNSLALLAIGTSCMTTAAWVLSNAHMAW